MKPITTLTIDGKTMTLKEWAAESGLSYTTIRLRVKCGLTSKEDLFEPAHRITITIDGETRTISEWARASGLSFKIVRDRWARGWPADQLLKPPIRREKGPKHVRQDRTLLRHDTSRQFHALQFMTNSEPGASMGANEQIRQHVEVRSATRQY